MTIKDHHSGWRFDHSYTALPTMFYERVRPESVREPGLAVWNEALAAELGLNGERLNTPAGAAIFAGNTVPDGADPIAQAYAGHQFGHFTMLGDGRAIVLGEHLTPHHRRVDIQWKGSGQTPYSRRGDGRAALGPMLREYLISEAMQALGIPTTRSLAVATTGEPVFRETPQPGAVLTRVADSHIRVGTFQYAAARRDAAALKSLVAYTLARHFPGEQESADPARALLQAVIEKQAQLIAQWMLVGFIHGVMNTDNMALSGETIDYGPCAFMDAFNPQTVYSSIDQRGRYAYGNQPQMAQWNLTRFAETLLPLLDEQEQRAIEIAQAELPMFGERFRQHWMRGMRAKLGLFTEEAEDLALIETLMAWMQTEKADYTNTFRDLTEATGPVWQTAWARQWQARLRQQSETREQVADRMRATNPAVIPRNHQVEAALIAATQSGEYGPFRRLLAAVTDPFPVNGGPDEAYRQPAPADFEQSYKTFCGT